MPHRNMSFDTIPVLFSLILIPQLFFHWLAPLTAVARTVVYCFGTVLTIAAPMSVFVVHSLYGLRRSAGVAITAVILELAAVLVSAILLIVDATVRSAIFALCIVALVYLAGLVPVVMSAARTDAMETASGSDTGLLPPAQQRRTEVPPAGMAGRDTGSPVRTEPRALPGKKR